MKCSDVFFIGVNTLYLYANGDLNAESSIAYNHITGISANLIKLFSEGNNHGWINENIFNVKRVRTIDINGNYAHNNNHFEKCNLEQGTIIIGKGVGNYFSARTERWYNN